MQLCYKEDEMELFILWTLAITVTAFVSVLIGGFILYWIMMNWR
jgi:hypothetical protein